METTIRMFDARLKPIANKPIDMNDPGWVKAFESTEPLEQAGIRPEAEELLRRILESYDHGTSEVRQRLRDFFERYRAFAWAAKLPYRPTTEEAFRQHLLLFSIADQGLDSRDAILWLQDLCAEASKAGVEIRRVLNEVAALSSNTDKYGMGSTQDQLRGAG